MQQTMVTDMIGLQVPCLLSLGEAPLWGGLREEARALAERALTLARVRQEHSNQAYARRLLGDIASRREPRERDQAEAYYPQAIALVDDLGMPPLQADCHQGLGTLYAKIDRPE